MSIDTDPTNSGAAQIETRTEQGDGPDGQVSFWTAEIARSDKVEKDWRQNATHCIEVYRRDVQQVLGDERSSTRFNVLYSNTETLAAAIHQQAPRPDVRPRFTLDQGQNPGQPPQPPMPPQPDPTLGVVGGQEMQAYNQAQVQFQQANQQYQTVLQAFLAKAAQNKSAKTVAEILERSLAFSIDVYDFDGMVSGVLQDMLLTGRGVPRVIYKPTFRAETPRVPVTVRDSIAGIDETGAAIPGPLEYIGADGQPIPEKQVKTDAEGPYILGEPFDKLVYEEVLCGCVPWDDFRVSPARSWETVRWVAFRNRLTRDEVVEEFDEETAKRVNYTETDKDAPEDAQDTFKRAVIWEIWDKTKRQQVFISPGCHGGPLIKPSNPKGEDPLKLEGFFPVPRPIYSLPLTGRLTPYPEYLIYEDQARELETITARIDVLTKALKLRGVHNAALPELANVLTAKDNETIPMESWEQLVAGGGLESALQFVPIDKLVAVLQQLYKNRDAAKQVIYEVMGLSDILRGASNPDETATAQDIKARWGSLRIDRRRREFQRLLRDLFRMKAEIIAEKFSPKTIQLMTGIEVTPDVQEVLKADALRSYRIDVETDTSADLEQDKKSITELLSAVVDFIAKIAPFVQTQMNPNGLIPLEAAKSMLMAAVRKFRMGREVEDALNQVGQGMLQGQGMPAQMPPALAGAQMPMAGAMPQPANNGQAPAMAA